MKNALPGHMDKLQQYCMDMLLTPQITKIESDSPVFGSLDWAPSSVNCIFGENGTGKTTLANAICEGKGLSWEEGFSASDVEVLRYDQHYVSLFFNRENRIPGIFLHRGSIRRSLPKSAH